MNRLHIQNGLLEADVDLDGGRVLHLNSRPFSLPVLHENPAGGVFPMLPLANRVASNRFIFQGREIILPHHHADADFFLHGDGWLQRWDVITQGEDFCTLQRRSQHACGFDYLAIIHYQLKKNHFVATMTLTHCGDSPMIYGCGFHPFFHFDTRSRLQFQASGYWLEGEQHLPLVWQDMLPEEADFSRSQYGRDRWLNIGYSGWGGQATISNDVIDVTILSQTSWLMLFRMQGEPFICLEPQTHPVNAHNMDGQPGLRVLARGESLEFTMTIATKQRD
ncbi:aldose 1-epimerase [Shigella flexneri]|nr:aldose 1-epimerase [Escherichia coli]